MFGWSKKYTQWGHIVRLETGWYDDTMAIVLDVPFVNSVYTTPWEPLGSDSCKITDSYALDPKDPGIKVHEAALLSAFVAGKKVRLLINECVYDKPRVIAVGLAD
jgi:hypothetical protein